MDLMICRMFVIMIHQRSDYWDTVALIEYESINNFCRMAQSAEWRSVHHFKVEGYADTHTYMTTPV